MIWTHILCFVIGAGTAVGCIYLGFWFNWKLTKPVGLPIRTPKPEEMSLSATENELEPDDREGGDEEFARKDRSVSEALM